MNNQHNSHSTCQECELNENKSRANLDDEKKNKQINKHENWIYCRVIAVSNWTSILHWCHRRCCRYHPILLISQSLDFIFFFAPVQCHINPLCVPSGCGEFIFKLGHTHNEWCSPLCLFDKIFFSVSKYRFD